MFLDVIQVSVVLKATDVHLCAYTVNLGNTVGFPFLYPVDERLQFLVVIPVRLSVIVVDEEDNILGAIFACQTTCLTDVLQVAHVILPIESISADIP